MTEQRVVTAEEHRAHAKRLRLLALREDCQYGLDGLLPALARIHDMIAAQQEGLTPKPQLLPLNDIDNWADGVTRRLVGVRIRPRPATTWDLWIRRLGID